MGRGYRSKNLVSSASHIKDFFIGSPNKNFVKSELSGALRMYPSRVRVTRLPNEFVIENHSGHKQRLKSSDTDLFEKIFKSKEKNIVLIDSSAKMYDASDKSKILLINIRGWECKIPYDEAVTIARDILLVEKHNVNWGEVDKINYNYKNIISMNHRSIREIMFKPH